MEFDYVIVGAGSAGCVLAHRLSEDPRARVALLEAGGRDKNIWIHIPVGFAKTLNDPSVNWLFHTEPDEKTRNRPIPIPARQGPWRVELHQRNALRPGARPRLRHLGAQLGNRGWSYDEVLPYFKRSENHEGGANEYHGVGGPLTVSEQGPDPSPLRRVHRGGEDLRLPPQPGRERRIPGRLRLLPGDDPKRPARERRPRRSSRRCALARTSPC